MLMKSVQLLEGEGKTAAANAPQALFDIPMGPARTCHHRRLTISLVRLQLLKRLPYQWPAQLQPQALHHTLGIWLFR